MHDDLTVLDAVVDVGANPWLDAPVEDIGEVHHAHPHPVAMKLQRRLDRRVAAAHHGHVLIEEWEGLLVVVDDPAVGLAVRQTQPVGFAEAAGGDDHGAGAEAVLTPITGARVYDKSSVAWDDVTLQPPFVRHFCPKVADNAGHFLVLADRQPVVRDHMPIVRQRLPARRFRLRDGERHPPDLEPLGRREEGHVVGVVSERFGDGATVEDGEAQAALLRRHRDGEAAGPRADDGEVEVGLWVSANLSPGWEWRFMRFPFRVGGGVQVHGANIITTGRCGADGVSFDDAPAWDTADFWTLEPEPEFVISGEGGASGAADDVCHFRTGPSD